MARTKGTIIVADDDEILRSIFDTQIRRLFPDYYLDILADGTSLEKRLTGSTDGILLVVTDNRMPGKNGSQIIEEYAKKLTMPFILFYAGEEAIGKRAKENGAFAYVPKLPRRGEAGGVRGLVGTVREALTYYNAQSSLPTESSQ